MPNDPRAERAEALRKLLLSLAQQQSLSDELLAEALALIKKPVEQISVTEFKLDQLLDELSAGNVQPAEFARLWIRLKLSQPDNANAATPRPRISVAQPPTSGFTPSKPFIAVVLLLALISVVYWRWTDILIWFANQQEMAVDNAAEEVRQATGSPARQLVEETTGTYAKQYVNEGINLASMAKVSVVEYYMSMGVYPSSNQQAGLAAPADIRGNGVDSVTVSEGGVITILFNHLVGEGKTLVLTPSSSGGGPVVWNCSGNGLPAEELPPHCR